MSKPLYDLLERMVKASAQHPELPPCISVAATEDGVWVTPYIRGTPVTALLGWHDAMKDVEREVDFLNFESGDVATVTLRGLLDDVPIIAQTTTHQEVRSKSGKVTAVELRRLAKEEEAF